MTISSLTNCEFIISFGTPQKRKSRQRHLYWNWARLVVWLPHRIQIDLHYSYWSNLLESAYCCCFGVLFLFFCLRPCISVLPSPNIAPTFFFRDWFCQGHDYIKVKQGYPLATVNQIKDHDNSLNLYCGEGGNLPSRVATKKRKRSL